MTFMTSVINDKVLTIKTSKSSAVNSSKENDNTYD